MARLPRDVGRAAVIHELTASFDVIGHRPQIGYLYRQSPVSGTRRILLKSSRYRAVDRVVICIRVHTFENAWAATAPEGSDNAQSAARVAGVCW